MGDGVWARRDDERVAWYNKNFIGFWGLQLAAIGVFFVPFSWDCVAVLFATYVVRIFGITGGYHRYFAHRGFKTGRIFQFVLAWLGLMASQKGPLWWSGLHRHHHKYSDMPEDIHSPKRGFWWSHQTWFLVPRYDETPASQLREFAAYPELLFINRYWHVGPTFLGLVLFLLGGLPWLFWGFFLSTTLTYHATFTVNSLAHVWGSRRYETTDTSRNNFFLALLVLGEGWHNNHHHYQSTANNGFFWWEIDITYAVLRMLSWVGIVWDLRTPPAWVLEGKTRRCSAARVGDGVSGVSRARNSRAVAGAASSPSPLSPPLPLPLPSPSLARASEGTDADAVADLAAPALARGAPTTAALDDVPPVEAWSPRDLPRMPERLVKAMGAVRRRREQLGEALRRWERGATEESKRVAEFRALLAEAAVEAAEHAREAACEAADAAKRCAYEIRDRLGAMSAADMAEAAAAHAREASAAAVEMAEELRTKVAGAWAEAAQAAARAAEDAARVAAEVLQTEPAVVSS
ncbi:MAG: acyl-CoA desaturase [Deltaproteobacteria bacterium]|nr:acyl-CoA desaturase [Deltaproteobacteria bacterium]